MPAPRTNLLRYHGCFGPAAKLRPKVARKARADSGVEDRDCGHKKNGRYLDWAQLMTRVFEFDVTRCPKCSTKGMQVIACITEYEVIRAILGSVGYSTAPPRVEPARWSEDDGSGLDTAA